MKHKIHRGVPIIYKDPIFGSLHSSKVISKIGSNVYVIMLIKHNQFYTYYAEASQIRLQK